MSAPTTPTTTTLTTEIAKAESWLKTHERLIIVTLAILAGLYIGTKVLDNAATRDRAAATQAAQVLTQQQAVNQQLATQIAIATKNNQDLVLQLTQQNAILQTQQTQRTVVLQQQVAVDKALPMPDLGNRWTYLASLKQGDLAATTAGITVTPQGALDTVTKLEQLPVAQSNLEDVTKQRDNLNTELGSTTDLNSKLVTQVDGLKTEAIDKDKSCKADIASVKADARKGKLKSFLYGAGVGVGVTLGLVLHAVL
jgi:multidrug efflux pump subunit AcrA (membrane-fusion protein)